MACLYIRIPNTNVTNFLHQGKLYQQNKYFWYGTLRKNNHNYKSEQETAGLSFERETVLFQNI